MGKFKITAPDGNSYVVTAPDGASQKDVLNYAKQNYKSASGPSAFQGIETQASPENLLRQAAPSNMLKQLGVLSVNAPGMFGLARNAVAGLGDPAQIIPSLQNIQKNPVQLRQALMRASQIQGGGQMTPREKVPGYMGQTAGTIIEMTAPSLGTPKIKSSGPFTAGMVDPSTALPGAFEKAGKELGSAKILARIGEDAKEAARLRGLLAKPAGIQKVAEEGKAAMEAGKDVSVTHLLAYREALGKMQEEGGVFANDYKIAKDLATEMLTKKAPDLMTKMGKMSTNFLARGNPKKTFPWFTTAINPEVGLMKSATLPVVRNVAGAPMGVLARFPGAASSLLNQVLKRYREDSNP